MNDQVLTNDASIKLSAAFESVAATTAQELRADALLHLQQLGLPNNKQEEYRYTPIARAFEKILNETDFTQQSPLAGDAAAHLIPELEANYLVFVDGRFDNALSKIVSPLTEVVIQPLSVAIREHQDVVQLHLGKHVDYKTDAFAALNTAYWQDGLFVHVPEKTDVKAPIFILHLHSSENRSSVNATRLLMVLEKESRAQLIQKFDTTGAHASFHSWVEEIVVSERAHLEYCKIQADAGAAYQVATTLIHQETESHVNTCTVTTDGKMIRNNFHISIDGERCESHFFGLYLLNKDTLADNHTVVDHRQPNSFSNELYKGVLDGTSRGIFNGKIYVRPYAQKTNAFQANKNVLLNDTCVIHTKPQLEIWADDVKCSHGCTSGQLDDEALFYLQSRGISKDQAQALLLYAFSHDVIASVKNEVLKTFLDSLISKRLQRPM